MTRLATPRARIALTGVFFVLWGSGCMLFRPDHPRGGGSAEHPRAAGQGHEHPEGAAPGHEHPEATGKERSSRPVSTDELAKAIEEYVRRDARLKGGGFVVYDPETSRPLALELARVHRDRLARLDDGRYFACADFRTAKGEKYDLDFFMKPSPSRLEVTEITIHKVEGRPRYDWVEEGGAWKRRRAGSGAGS
ncbi:MAG: hypothetical protein ACREQ9_15620 [Candidatus Binatia bacterium]